MPGWSPAVTRAIEVLQDLRDVCYQYPSCFITPEDFDAALGPLKFIDERRNGPMPALEDFTQRSAFFDSMQRVMWTLQFLARGRHASWGCHFSTLSIVLQLVFVRNEAAFNKYGTLEHQDDGLRAYQQYVRPYDEVVASIWRAQLSLRWPDVRDLAVQFVSQQLFSHIMAQTTSGSCYASFTLGMQREAGAMYLALIYQEIDPQRVLVADSRVRAVTVLGIAEGITRPLDGVRTQALFAAHLRAKWNGHLSAGLVSSLSAAQIHALRSPLRVWPQAKTICHHCSALFEKTLPRRVCTGCRRALYCSASCQRLDWRPFHKAACGLWRFVAEREAFRRVRAQIKKLPLDPIRHFPL